LQHSKLFDIYVTQDSEGQSCMERATIFAVVQQIDTISANLIS